MKVEFDGSVNELLALAKATAPDPALIAQITQLKELLMATAAQVLAQITDLQKVVATLVVAAHSGAASQAQVDNMSAGLQAVRDSIPADLVTAGTTPPGSGPT